MSTSKPSRPKGSRTTPTTKIPTWFQAAKTKTSVPTSPDGKQLTLSGIAELETMQRKHLEGALDTLQTQSFRLNCTLRSQLHAVRQMSGKHVGSGMTERKLSPDQLHKRNVVVRSTLARIKKAAFFTDIVPVLRDKGPKIWACDRVNLWVLKEQSLETASASSLRTLAIPMGQDLVGSVAATATNINLASAPADNRFLGMYDTFTGYVTASTCCVVCVDDFGRTLAVIELLNKKLSRFDAGDEKIAKKICLAMSMYLK